MELFLTSPYLIVAGWREVSLVDVLEGVSFTLWLSYCNFRCPWCSNSKIARGLLKKRLPVDRVVEAVKAAASFVDYLHVTGGEPTLQLKPLKKLFLKIRELTNLSLSINTNGSNPLAVKELLPLLDHIAIDIKAPLTDPYKYSNVIGLSLSETKEYISKIAETVNVSLQVPFLEFRTTVVPGLLTVDDVLKIADYLEKTVSKRTKSRVAFVIQQFIPYNGILVERYRKLKRTPPDILKEIAVRVAESARSFEVYYRSLEEGVQKIK
ncbi:MAG: anaerobic ribonucleoside-triphosphate reductase activating protein [Thermoprotei archaeon]|nr:MAG: anaerobic ribonucleoside-triphosphate reductase activating protein [Thermoprotei archaeon]RLF02622.1 MAG: anaerobic ribonucleoside-triphosphate reductase activating protein [Thermoprotei archaeon]